MKYFRFFKVLKNKNFSNNIFFLLSVWISFKKSKIFIIFCILHSPLIYNREIRAEQIEQNLQQFIHRRHRNMVYSHIQTLDSLFHYYQAVVNNFDIKCFYILIIFNNINYLYIMNYINYISSPLDKKKYMVFVIEILIKNPLYNSISIESEVTVGKSSYRTIISYNIKDLHEYFGKMIFLICYDSFGQLQGVY